MLKTIQASFALALHNIRSNFFHTILSVLGIVIGVGALVSILSLIDGMEEVAREQISGTTDLKSIQITTQTTKRSENISIRKDTVTVFDKDRFAALTASLQLPHRAWIFQRKAREVVIERDTIRRAAYVTAVVGLDTSWLVAGRNFTQYEEEHGGDVCILTEHLAGRIRDANTPVLGLTINDGDRNLEVIGVVRLPKSNGSELFFPFGRIKPESLQATPPVVIVEAENVEDVMALQAGIVSFINVQFAPSHDFAVVTNEFRVEQAAKGFLLFRIITGLIVGISVVVGGIGVMNVLLISVTERTSEIGIRKAVGANRRHIILQFLSESITISLFGSLVGMAFGILATMGVVPIVRSITEMPFRATLTFNTLMVVSVLAVAVGIVFGTYPAIRASRLDPTEAIRRNE